MQVAAPEPVYSWPEGACGRDDTADMAVRAVRLPDRSILMAAGNSPDFRFLRGPTLDRLRRDCAPGLSSLRSRAPDAFRGREWIMATYRVGDTIHALVHDEFHDPVAARCKPGDDSPGNPCWYNAITYAFSIDGGRSFRQPPGTAHVVAPPPSRWDAAAAGRGGYQISGYLEPSNIVRGADGYFYVLIRAVPDIRRQKLRGTCVLRTRTLGEPSSWRAWDGQSFSLELTNPYDAPAEGSRPCAFVSHGRIGDLNGSLSYNTYLREYLLIGSWVRRSGSARVCGFFFSRSTDLVHWSSPELIREAALPHARAGCRPANAPRKGAELYPSILDPVDTSVNFERSGREPYLYFIRYGHHWAERQLLRQRIRLTRRDGHDPGASMR